jgi:hypothetical protein
MKKTFNSWLLQEKKDIFGFNSFDDVKKDGLSNKVPPLHRIKLEEVIDELLSNNIGSKIPHSKFNNSIQWGIGPGSIYMEVSPLGSFKGIIRRLSSDAAGSPIWICKKVIPFYDYLEADIKFDKELAHDLMEQIKDTNETTLESPSRDYDDLENLTLTIAETCQLPGTIPLIFIYKGIRRVVENKHYIIYFELKGQGVEAPGSSRVEQHHINVSYDKIKGSIKIFNNDIQSPTRVREWIPQPSEFEEYFFPNQPKNEIAECVAGALSTY